MRHGQKQPYTYDFVVTFSINHQICENKGTMAKETFRVQLKLINT